MLIRFWHWLNNKAAINNNVKFGDCFSLGNDKYMYITNYTYNTVIGDVVCSMNGVLLINITNLPMCYGSKKLVVGSIDRELAVPPVSRFDKRIDSKFELFFTDENDNIYDIEMHTNQNFADMYNECAPIMIYSSYNVIHTFAIKSLSVGHKFACVGGKYSGVNVVIGFVPARSLGNNIAICYNEDRNKIWLYQFVNENI